MRQFIPEKDLWPIQNDAWDAHNTEYTLCIRDRGYDRNQLMVDQVRDMFGTECESTGTAGHAVADQPGGGEEIFH